MYTHIYLYIYIGTLRKIFAVMTVNIKNYLLFFLSYNIAISISKAFSAGAPVQAVAFLVLASALLLFREVLKTFLLFFPITPE